MRFLFLCMLFLDQCKITLSGGNLRNHGAILTGDCAMRNLLMVQADKAFIGCTVITDELAPAHMVEQLRFIGMSVIQVKKNSWH